MFLLTGQYVNIMQQIVGPSPTLLNNENKGGQLHGEA